MTYDPKYIYPYQANPRRISPQPKPTPANMDVKIIVGRDGVIHVQNFYNGKVINNVDISPDKIQEIIEGLEASKEKSVEMRAKSIKEKITKLKEDYEKSVAPFNKELEALGYIQ